MNSTGRQWRRMLNRLLALIRQFSKFNKPCFSLHLLTEVYDWIEISPKSQGWCDNIEIYCRNAYLMTSHSQNHPCKPLWRDIPWCNPTSFSFFCLTVRRDIKLSSIQTQRSARFQQYFSQRLHIPPQKKKNSSCCRNLMRFFASTSLVGESTEPLIELQSPCSNTAASMGFCHTASPLDTKDMHSCCTVAQKLNVISGIPPNPQTG